MKQDYYYSPEMFLMDVAPEKGVCASGSESGYSINGLDGWYDETEI